MVCTLTWPLTFELLSCTWWHSMPHFQETCTESEGQIISVTSKPVPGAWHQLTELFSPLTYKTSPPSSRKGTASTCQWWTSKYDQYFKVFFDQCVLIIWSLPKFSLSKLSFLCILSREKCYSAAGWLCSPATGLFLIHLLRFTPSMDEMSWQIGLGKQLFPFEFFRHVNWIVTVLIIVYVTMTKGLRNWCGTARVRWASEWQLTTVRHGGRVTWRWPDRHLFCRPADCSGSTRVAAQTTSLCFALRTVTSRTLEGTRKLTISK